MLKKLNGSPKWAKGLSIDLEEQLIYCWSPDQKTIALFKLPDGELMMSSTNMVAYDDLVVDLLYMSKFRYLVIATKEGELRIHRLV